MSQDEQFKHPESTGWVVADRYPDNSPFRAGWFRCNLTAGAFFENTSSETPGILATVGLSLQAWLENRGWVCSVQSSNENSWDAVTLLTLDQKMDEHLHFLEKSFLQKCTTYNNMTPWPPLFYEIFGSTFLLQLSRHHCCCWASCCASLQVQLGWLDLNGFDNALFKCLVNLYERGITRGIWYEKSHILF